MAVAVIENKNTTIVWDQLAVEKIGASYGCTRSLLHRCEILSLW